MIRHWRLFLSTVSLLFCATTQAGSYGLIDNEDGTVSDLTTSLMWQQTPLSLKPSYSLSRTYCRDRELGGYDDWRVPEVKEALSLMDYRQKSPALNTLIFPDAELQSGEFWVQSSDLLPVVVRTVSTMFGTVSAVRTSTGTGIAQVRCVRTIFE